MSTLSVPRTQLGEGNVGEEEHEQQTLYFAYGSNLSFEQMARRCPDSHFLGRARLPNHRFQINERGFANVVAHPDSHVEGLCYRLSELDEEQLDCAEGVPKAYEKVELEIELFPAPSSLPETKVASIAQDRTYRQTLPSAHQQQQQQQPKPATALVYLSTEYTSPGQPWDEYILRMEKGLDEALRMGVSEAYVNQVVRPWLALDKGERDAL